MIEKEVLKMLQHKRFEIYHNHCNIFINRKNKRFHISFNLSNPTENITCATDVQICTCVTYCCGRKFDNFIIESKEVFEKEIDNLIKKYLE